LWHWVYCSAMYFRLVFYSNSNLDNKNLGLVNILHLHIAVLLFFNLHFWNMRKIPLQYLKLLSQKYTYKSTSLKLRTLIKNQLATFIVVLNNFIWFSHLWLLYFNFALSFFFNFNKKNKTRVWNRMEWMRRNCDAQSRSTAHE
jgi:hypothetical protein